MNSREKQVFDSMSLSGDLFLMENPTPDDLPLGYQSAVNQLLHTHPNSNDSCAVVELSANRKCEI
jgi:hypothetical protein